MKRCAKIFDCVFLITLCTVIVALGLGIFLLPQKSFSEKENRSLSTMPSVSLSSVISGRFFDELNSFYSDQIPMRNEFTAIYSLTEKSLGKIETNGVIHTKSKAVVALPQYSEISKVKRNLNAVYSMSSQRSVFLYIPARSFDAFKNELPAIYPRESAESIIELLSDDTLEDFRELSENAKNGLYYTTDHHWTTDGAYFAYQQICRRMGIEAYSEEYFTKTTVCEDFRGTSASKSGLPNWLIPPDSITLFRYKNDEDFIIENHESKQTQKGFYVYSALNSADKYRIFLGGNYSHISIRAQEDDNRPKLLLIKDSFANSVIPFLALHFDIEVIDPRYCSKSFLQEQLVRDDIDQTLVLMGFDTLATDIFN